MLRRSSRLNAVLVTCDCKCVPKQFPKMYRVASLGRSTLWSPAYLDYCNAKWPVIKSLIGGKKKVEKSAFLLIWRLNWALPSICGSLCKLKGHLWSQTTVVLEAFTHVFFRVFLCFYKTWNVLLIWQTGFCCCFTTMKNDCLIRIQNMKKETEMLFV